MHAKLISFSSSTCKFPINWPLVHRQSTAIPIGKPLLSVGKHCQPSAIGKHCYISTSTPSANRQMVLPIGSCRRLLPMALFYLLPIPFLPICFFILISLMHACLLINPIGQHPFFNDNHRLHNVSIGCTMHPSAALYILNRLTISSSYANADAD